MIADADDSDNAKKVTAQSIADLFGGSSADAPKLIETFSCDAGTAVGDIVIADSTSGTVLKIADNLSSTIPNGIFGVVFAKPSSTTASVLFSGIIDAYSGFTVGLPIFVHTDGTPTQTIPTTGILQQIGFAVSSTSFFVQLLLPLELS